MDVFRSVDDAVVMLLSPEFATPPLAVAVAGTPDTPWYVTHKTTMYQALKDKGVVTYKDDDKMKQGKTIGNQLTQAIRGSRFFIIVFSKSYASSSWCLDELVEIMECQKTGQQTAYPVFLDVEPTQVRKQSGPFGKAFLENRNKDAAGKWIEALKGASNLVGRELQATVNGHEAEFIKNIVGDISLELHSISFGFDENLVGMETRVKDFVSSLEAGTNEVRMIGIKGMGGAGKTTTARGIFDHLSADFEAKIFVENVREVSNASMFGLKNLQEQVLSDVLNEYVTVNGVNDGKNMMKKRMCGKKVLLVLDDVDHIEQLKALASDRKWFKPGSRILITTGSRILMSKYAFGRENPLQGYEELSGKVVRYAAGLPLTVEVLGSFLCGKDMVEWEDAIKRLKKIPLKETLENLELSYISLEDEYKGIFLDIACILKGEDREDAIRILESCGFHSRIGLKFLEQRSLITISKNEVLGMHDHIEEMGKNIVRRSHPDEPNKHSHLWIDEEIEDILANDMGTKATRCLKLDMLRRNSRIVLKGLGKMKKLRYLEANFANYDSSQLDESTLCFPNSLKYVKNVLVTLSCIYPEHFKQTILLDLKWSLAEEWITPNLETLSLNDSFNLKELCMPASCQKLNYLEINHSKLRTFDLGLTLNLETLSFHTCADFVELHVSVACPNLKFLDLCGLRLRSLDLELIPNLERLDLGYSDELVEINAPIRCLKRVLYFDLSGCLRFHQFGFGCGYAPSQVSRSSATLDLIGESLVSCPLHPNSNLPNLQFSCYYDENLPSSVGNIEKLISFGLCACTDLKKFSDIICSLQCLQKLALKCNIPEFPKDLGITSSELLEKLPDDLGQLECLEKLYVSSKKIEHLPDSICMLKRLKSLNVTSCSCLGKLPEDIGQLECLEELCLSSTNIKQLPDSICMLKHLKNLTVTYSDVLEKLPEDLGQLECLEKLYVSSKKIEYLPDSICMLKHLKFLNLSRCTLLEKLPEDLGRLECLEQLVIPHTGISHLPQSIFGLKGLLIEASYKLLKLYDLPCLGLSRRIVCCALKLAPKQKIKIKLRSYWVPIIEDSCKQIMDVARTTNAKTMGPIRTHKRLVDILHPTAQTIDSLMQLDLPAGVNVEVKL
ncbi:disease resistance protein (TIR-NBS-LRR class) [Artemisia annua]|uniref:Disease resistance protein (TIR-NBS-LRR class) n=1 Tax=Artemisia annua TaxID=35608 RepID=A0A2U1Q3L9_ARTAN|nr:disease resistance protein (TIR-NBS-LRR class) [Artemisia annua]